MEYGFDHALNSSSLGDNILRCQSLFIEIKDKICKCITLKGVGFLKYYSI